ncbi:MAG: hypothetical protein JW920_11160 [Deltaproteobacteria bacterium]|nr:hypothetical protein [Deltaproteobacteria bacterium]
MGRFFLKAAALSVIISIVYNAISGSILWRFRFIYLDNFYYPRELPADTMTTQTLFFVSCRSNLIILRQQALSQSRADLH